MASAPIPARFVEGELFVALDGPNFDGRDYVGKAGEKGAAGAVVSALVETLRCADSARCRR